MPEVELKEYLTQYEKFDIDAGEHRIIASSVYARDFNHAKKVAKQRGKNEIILGELAKRYEAATLEDLLKALKTAQLLPADYPSDSPKPKIYFSATQYNEIVSKLGEPIKRLDAMALLVGFLSLYAFGVALGVLIMWLLS